MRDGPKTAELLGWYDRHARELPWRVSPSDRASGVVPDPYAVWLSEIMLQQTTVAAVRDYFTRFMSIWPTVQDLAGAEDDRVMGEWAGLGYYARARNLLKCAREVTALGGFPTTRDGLQALPGIGPYTSAAISAIAYDLPETVVDGNVERVMSRVFHVKTPLPDAKGELTQLAETLTPQNRAGDYAQAVMDLGATICTPKSPACGICPWNRECSARTAGVQAELPKKKPKAKKPTRFGVAYLARNEAGEWLMERRPEKGLLGGMLGWPGAEWGDAVVEHPPFEADWQDPGVEVRHVFTHFNLQLSLRVVQTNGPIQPKQGLFLDIKRTDLPTVMRKAFDVAVSHLSH
ncbi:A/G-specific adenine glycosylase [Aliiroseovarius sp. S253]|uniref:A/G-specific adenine glycosylase n=1 Tax=Aliiroseovarius sp. S253 TaxID=3415133 RepID=UPI003C7A2595